MFASGPVIAPASFARVLEVARAALAGLECLTLSVRYGLDIPMDRIATFGEAIATARRELDGLETWAAGGDETHVH